MTIDERVEALATAAHCFDKQFRADARRILLEVARDQRLACCDAIHAMAPEDVCRGIVVSKLLEKRRLSKQMKRKLK